MKYLSLFSGIGGFEIPAEELGWESIGFSEIDKYAIKIHNAHFSQKNWGDVTKIVPQLLPDFDIIFAGFPCQSFSVAGKRLGFEDTRGTLFFEIARICREKKPKYLLLENVKGLLSHDGGNTFSTIIRVLTDIGYDLQWQLLNSKDFGVPQNRERVFIVGHLRGESRPEVFPLTGANQEDTRIVGEDVSYAIDANYSKGTNTLEKGRRQLVFKGGITKNKKWLEGKDLSRNFSQGERVYGEEGISPTLSAQSGGTAGTGSALIQLNQPKHSNDRVYSEKGLSPTLNTMQGGRRQPFVALTETRTEEAKRIRSQNMKEGKDWSPRRGKKLVPREDGLSNTITAGQSKEHYIQSIPHGFNPGWKKPMPNLRAHSGAIHNELLVSKTVRAGGRKSPHGSKQNWDSYDVEGKIRRLTPMECERLQGFPDKWTKVEGVSDTQRYKCLGNAVTVNVVRAILGKFHD